MGHNSRRMFKETPAVIMVAIVLLAVVKGF